MSESPNDSGESPSSNYSYQKYQEQPKKSYDYGESPGGESPSSSNSSRRKYR